MFAHAISSTSPAIHISRCRCDAYCSCMAWMPAPPGVSTTWALANSALPCSEENSCSPQTPAAAAPLSFSCSGAIATPGFTRPTM